MNINQLSALGDIQAADLFAVWDASSGDTRGSSMSLLLSYLQANLSFATAGSANFATQYASPSSTGFSVTLTDGSSGNTNIHLILTPTAGYAAGTLVLPVNTGLVDKQEIIVNSTQQVTTLTINGNGATVTGEPTTLAADSFFRLKYDKPTNVWYRIG